MKEKEPSIENIKKSMLEWKDFLGGDLINKDLIDKAKTKKDLEQIISLHEAFLDSVHSDMMSHISDFRQKLKLHLL
jgi:hypothetical protein